MNLKKGNLVKVLAGKDKNKSGEIIEVINKLNRAKVKGINFVKKHIKTTKEKKGGIISKENFIHLSNLKIVDNKKDKTEIKKRINKK
jgi:large subunit ribosomal protein L24